MPRSTTASQPIPVFGWRAQSCCGIRSTSLPRKLLHAEPVLASWQINSGTSNRCRRESIPIQRRYSHNGLIKSVPAVLCSARANLLAQSRLIFWGREPLQRSINNAIEQVTTLLNGFQGRRLLEAGAGSRGRSRVGQRFSAAFMRRTLRALAAAVLTTLLPATAHPAVCPNPTPDTAIPHKNVRTEHTPR